MVIVFRRSEPIARFDVEIIIAILRVHRTRVVIVNRPGSTDPDASMTLWRPNMVGGALASFAVMIATVVFLSWLKPSQGQAIAIVLVVLAIVGALSLIPLGRTKGVRTIQPLLDFFHCDSHRIVSPVLCSPIVIGRYKFINTPSMYVHPSEQHVYLAVRRQVGWVDEFIYLRFDNHDLTHAQLVSWCVANKIPHLEGPMVAARHHTFYSQCLDEADAQSLKRLLVNHAGAEPE